MSTQSSVPSRLASEDVIINAPMSHAGSAQRIWRLRRRADGERALVAVTTLVIVLVLTVWALVTVWYLIWGLWLVPYRLLRRSARNRKAEMLRHRELLGVVQGSAAASAAVVVTATAGQLIAEQQPAYSSADRAPDPDRDRTIDQLRQHLIAGRLSASEFESRVDSVHGAKTLGTLDAVLSDLPKGAPAASPVATDGSSRAVAI